MTRAFDGRRLGIPAASSFALLALLAILALLAPGCGRTSALSDEVAHERLCPTALCTQLDAIVSAHRAELDAILAAYGVPRV